MIGIIQNRTLHKFRKSKIFIQLQGRLITAVHGQVDFIPCIDVSGDDFVDFTDTLEILSSFGASVPPADPS